MSPARENSCARVRTRALARRTRKYARSRYFTRFRSILRGRAGGARQRRARAGGERVGGSAPIQVCGRDVLRVFCLLRQQPLLCVTRTQSRVRRRGGRGAAGRNAACQRTQSGRKKHAPASAAPRLLLRLRRQPLHQLQLEPARNARPSAAQRTSKAESSSAANKCEGRGAHCRTSGDAFSFIHARRSSAMSLSCAAPPPCSSSSSAIRRPLPRGERHALDARKRRLLPLRALPLVSFRTKKSVERGVSGPLPAGSAHLGGPPAHTSTSSARAHGRRPGVKEVRSGALRPWRRRALLAAARHRAFGRACPGVPAEGSRRPASHAPANGR